MTTTVRFTSVATGRYLEYWKDFVRSVLTLKASIPDEFEVSFAVLTNSPESVAQFAEELGTVSLQVFIFSETTWPAATLLRYEAYSSHSHEIQNGADFIIHVDADMVMRSWPGPEVWEQLRESDILLVTHPGYFRSSSLLKRLISFALGQTGREDWERIGNDIMRRLNGGIGDWETSPNSSAFVRRKQRRIYLCGGIWFVTRREFSGLTNDIAEQIRQDSGNGVIARWHDESHLNHWAVKNESKHEVLGPEFCFAKGYWNLRGVNPVFEAIEKGPNRVR